MKSRKHKEHWQFTQVGPTKGKIVHLIEMGAKIHLWLFTVVWYFVSAPSAEFKTETVQYCFPLQLIFSSRVKPWPTDRWRVHQDQDSPRDKKLFAQFSLRMQISRIEIQGKIDHLSNFYRQVEISCSQIHFTSNKDQNWNPRTQGFSMIHNLLCITPKLVKVVRVRTDNAYQKAFLRFPARRHWKQISCSVDVCAEW